MSTLQLPRETAEDAGTALREALCAHCGLPTVVSPAAIRSPAIDPEQVFCCQGCRGAYELIQGWGLESYYELRDQGFGSARTPASGAIAREAAFEDDAFLGLSKPIPEGDGLLAAQFALHGLHCAACAWLIENAAARTPGWQLARVKMSDHTVKVVFDPQQIRLSRIAKLIGQLGYELLPLTGQRDDHFRWENRKLLVQIAVAGFLAANAMWIAIALYAGEASGVAESHRTFFRLMGTALGVAAVMLPGRTFFTGALASLRMRTPHMDVPVALGLLVGTCVGSVNALTGRGDVYFDSLAVLVFLLLIGRWIQFRQQHRAARAIDLLLRVTPRHARRIDADGQDSWVLAESLQPGDTVRVAAGESVPVDGRIVRGQSTLDRSLLTGESRPVAANVGDNVSAGTVNMARAIDVAVEAIGRESRIGKIMQTVETAMADKTPVVQLADRIGGVFVVVVTVLAVITLLAWSRQGWDVAAAHATSLLIVACPCALALATPLAIAVSLGRAAGSKLLIRDGASLQQLARPGMIWFDKTGTLTEGRARAELIFGSADALQHAAAVERGCCHPISDAIVRLAADHATSTSAVPTHASASEAACSSEVHVGGICGESAGHRVHVGNLAFMHTSHIQVDDTMLGAVESCLSAAASPVVIAVDDVAVAVLGISDPLKAQARDVISQLKQFGWNVGILSGDHPEVVQHVARQIGIDPSRAFGGLTPEDKLAVVRDPARATVLMIGDGANDAAALAAADIGVAVRGGAEVSLQAAPIFLASGNLSGVTDLIHGAGRTASLIVAAFAVSLGYNLVAVSLAMAGHITPLMAAVLMPISSVTVLSMTLLWPTFRESHA